MDNYKTIYFFAPHAEENNEIITHLSDIFSGLGIETVQSTEEADIIASIGGDGDFLQAVRKNGFRDDCVYLGIAVDDSNYFYVDFHYREIDMLKEAFKQDDVDVRNYPALKVTINDNKPSYCLNEFTLRSSIIKTIKMDVYINDFLFEQFNGDGILAATPTGSTGYNKSLGGAVVDPLIQAMQVTELASVNNNTHRTLGTSFLLNRERPLTLLIDKNVDYYPIMSLDNEALSVRNTEKVEIGLSDKFIKTLKLKNNTFWHKAQRNFL
ncbi:NAD kinase [Salinicoccus albus]|uniref:NAD kinase n=1 Tax=Salinicoccus albus TaxID=418756 RepID=UPI000372F21C